MPPTPGPAATGARLAAFTPRPREHPPSMLDTFRNASQTWIVKLLFALLALSFLAWGIGDVVRRGIFGTTPAIEVGRTALSAAEVNAEFKRDVERLQPMFGGKLTTEDARKMGLMDRTIESIVSRTLADEAAQDLGLRASDETILREVTSNPDLRDSTGKFDRQRLDAALARMGLSEESFMREQRADQMRNQLAAALSGGAFAPDSVVDPLVRHRQEQRVADTVTVPDTAVPMPAAPDDAALEAYYKANTRRFMAPEFRAVTVMLLRPADVADQIKITDQMIQDAYQQRRGEFNTTEHRQVSQILIDTKADADKADALVKEGKDLAAIAKALNRQVIDLGNVEESDLPAPLGARVFAQAPGRVAPSIHTDLGWHVVQVGAVTPAHNRSLAEVRGQIEQDLRAEKAGDLLADLSNKVEDAMGGGASMEEAAKRFNLTIEKFPAIDAHGSGPDGKPVAGLPKAASFLDVAFHADINDESQLTENPGDGYFMLRVDSVTPPRPKPLTAVRAEATADWQGEKRHAAARERAEHAAEQLKGGTPAAVVAKAVGGQVAETKPFTRDGADAGDLPPALIGRMFDAQPGAVAVDAGKADWVAARLSRIIPFDPAAHADTVKAAHAELAKSIAGDLVDEYLAALNAKYGVKVDRAELNREE